MDPRLRTIILAAGAAVVFIAWYLYWGTAAVQVPRTFARIRAGVEAQSAGEVFDQLHPDYSIPANWPAQVAEHGDLVSTTQLRALAQLGLQSVLRSHNDDPLVMSYDIHRFEVLGDGTVRVDVSIQFGTRSGHEATLIEPPLVHKHFILARASSIFPALSIKSHEPLSARE